VKSTNYAGNNKPGFTMF